MSVVRPAVVAACCLVACHVSPVSLEASEFPDGLRVVHISGTPYELGRQHGEALREEVRASVRRVLGYFRGYVKIPLVGSWLADWWLDAPWKAAQPFLSADRLEELRGLSDGSGVPLRELYRLHAIPDRTYSCSNFAAWGRATAGGRLIHMRNLDWSMAAGIQEHAVVFVVRPKGKHAFINVAWAGFIGVLTGVNDATISVGQVGAKTVDADFHGEPMVFLMRRVLEDAGTLDAAAKMVVEAPRTIGANYVFADANTRRAIVLETTHRRAKLFEADDASEHAVSYARPMADCVFRADAAVDPLIRERQLASHGNPARPGLEDPSGSSAYDVRYLGQAAGLGAYYGSLDPVTAQRIARAVAPDSNVQSVVFAWPELWVANAHGTTPAAQQPYHRLNAKQLFESPQS